MSNIAIYLRSARANDPAIQRQREACHAYCKAQGWVADIEYVDDGYAGTERTTRPGYDRLTAAIEAGEVERVIIHDTDRISRQNSQLLRFIDLTQAHNVEIHTPRGHFDFMNDGERMFQRILEGIQGTTKG